MHRLLPREKSVLIVRAQGSVVRQYRKYRKRPIGGRRLVLIRLYLTRVAALIPAEIIEAQGFAAGEAPDESYEISKVRPPVGPTRSRH